MATAGDIIQDALELLGVYGQGDTVSSADSSRMLSVLNDMLDVWSNESLACYTELTQTFTMQSGVARYSVGPGGAINGVRPLRVLNAPGSAFILDVNNNRYLMTVVDNLTWNLQTTSTANTNLPDTLWYDPQYPLGFINIWPTPDINYTCSFMSYQQLGGFINLQAAFSLPPGYKRAITTNLAVTAKPYFTSSQLDPDVREEARETKGSVKRNNMRAQISVYDPELVARGVGTYNIYSDRGSGRQ